MAAREHFGSRMAVVMAMAGSAIGLGNIWRFPYMVGEHGGAAFVLVYVLASILVSLPVFIAEVVVGRCSRTSAYGSMSKLAPGRKIWAFAGALSVFIPLLIASYYSVIGGWSLDFLFRSLSAEFVKGEPEAVSGIFGEFSASGWAPVLMHLLFLASCCLIVVLGVKSGIEKFSKVSMPVLFVLIVAMAVYSITLPGAKAGVDYLLKPDFSQLDARSFAYALGQSFYSLSLGMGAIITYGSYVKKEENIVASSAGTAVADLMFAILAGLAIMPAVFAAGIEPGAGPGLIFQSIPFIFSSLGTKLPVLSTIMCIVFFLTVLVAAMTSCISLLEVGASFLGEKFGVSRKKACLLLFLVCGGVGVLCAKWGKVLDVCDWLSSNILLLILAFITVIFVGFVMKKQDVREEITNYGEKKGNVRLFNVLYFLIKWVAPIFIAVIFVSNFIL